MLFVAASADNLAFFGGIIYLVSTKLKKKTANLGEYAI